MSRRFSLAMPLTLGVLLLLALALSTPPSAAGSGPAHALLPLSGPAFTGSSASTHTPAPPGQAPIAAASGRAGVQARYCTDLLRNGGFESGNFMYWTASGAPIVLSTGGRTGSHSAQLGGRDNALDRISQAVTCPFSGDWIEIPSYIYIHTTESGFAESDVVTVKLRSTTGAFVLTYQVYVGTRPADTWMPLLGGAWGDDYLCHTPGQTVQIEIEAATGASNPTWFLVDDVGLAPCCSDDPREPNSNFAAASAVSPGSHDLRLCPSGDEDWFHFDATAGQLIYLRLQIVEAGQATVCLVSPTGQEAGCDWDIYPYTATLARTATASGSWRARVHDPGYHTFGKLLRLGIEVSDAPSTATPTATLTRTRTPTPTRTRTPIPGATASPTGTATRTRTPTPSRTRTPTVTGVAPRVFLPVVLKDFWQPRPEDCTELVSNGGFEDGLAPWGSSGAAGRGPGRTGAWGGRLGGQNSAYGELIQWIDLPAGASPAPWEFWWRAEAAGQQPNDVLRALIQAPDEEPVLLTLPAVGALNAWRHAIVDLSPYAGKGFFLSYGATTDASVPPTFLVDDVSVKACVRP